MKTLPFFILLSFFTPALPLQAQTLCDTAKAVNMVAQAHTTWLGEQFEKAPEQLLAALPFLKNCPDATALQLDVYGKAASWYTSLEQFEKARETLETARKLAKTNSLEEARIVLLQARLDLASRQYEHVKHDLDALLANLVTTKDLQTEVWVLQAKLNFFLTKPEEGIACLDAALALLPSLPLRVEAWGARVELDLLSGDFKHGVALADSVLEITAGSTEPAVMEIRYRLLETSGRMARSIIGTRDGYERLLAAKALAESMPPCLRIRWLPSALSMLVYSTFEQVGYEAADSVSAALEAMLQPERLSHKACRAEAYTQHGRSLNVLGQYEEAITFCEQSNALLRTMPGANNQRISANYLFQLTSYRMMGDYEAAIAAGEKSLALRKNEQPGYIGLAAIYNEIVQAYLGDEDSIGLRKALVELEKVVNSQKDQSNLEQYRHAIAFSWLEYWALVDQPLKGIAQAEDFLKTSGAKARMRGIITTDLEYKICDAYRFGGKYREAFDRLEPIVVRMKKRYLESGSIYYEHYSWVLAQSAFNALTIFEQMGDTAMLRQAELRCTEAEDILFALRQRDPHEGQRKFVTDEFLYTCLLRIRAALFQRTGDRKHVERAFAVSESFQLVDFQRILGEKQALHFGGVEPEAAKAELTLQKRMASLEAEKSGLRFQEPGPETDAAAARIELRLSMARNSYDSLLSSLEKRFPSYYELKYKLPVLSMETVQKQVLKPGQCLLKMYYLYDTVICLLLRPDTCLLRMTSFGTTTQDNIIRLLDGLQKYPEQSTLPEAAFADKQQAFAQAAHQVYRSMLAPLAPWLSEEIILEPNKVLSSLPFEALLVEPATQPARPATWHYLGNDKIISYTTSATVFQFVQQRPAFRSKLQPALAMAPYFTGNVKTLETDDVVSRVRADYFSPLPHTGKEAAAVAQLLHGKVSAGVNCSVSDFLGEAENYKVLHLATHASAGGNGRPAFISFQAAHDDWRSAMLFESDIYAMQLSADLVTLSACETALGKTRYGDGLQGLTRAFTCAGARNIVASLWTVNDAATKDLMINFYQEIEKGGHYNRALALAKRNFVQGNRQFAHPYYWAGFVLNGR